MKIHKIFSVLLGAAVLLSGCAKDEELGKQNKNKERPTVSITKGDNTVNEFNFTLTPSEDTQVYGYVVFEGKDNEVPTAYDIVTGAITSAFTSAQYIKEDNATVSVKVNCSESEDYQIFAAAISGTGLLSEVTEMTWNIPGATPAVNLAEGQYSLSYEAASGVENTESGKDFPVVLKKYKGLQYILAADWFNLLGNGKLQNPQLIGTVDLTNNVIKFDGTYISNGEIQSGKAFGSAFNKLTSGELVAFWGGGESGQDGFNISFDPDTGYLTKLNGTVQLGIHNPSDGSMIGIYDELNAGTFKFTGPLQ